jgi:hypothetical protein
LSWRGLTVAAGSGDTKLFGLWAGKWLPYWQAEDDIISLVALLYLVQLASMHMP